MLLKTILNSEEDRKWEIYQKAENEYFYKYYEFFQAIGWRFVYQEGKPNTWYFTKESIEWEFDIAI